MKFRPFVTIPIIFSHMLSYLSFLPFYFYHFLSSVVISFISTPLFLSFYLICCHIFHFYPSTDLQALRDNVLSHRDWAEENEEEGNGGKEGEGEGEGEKEEEGNGVTTECSEINVSS